MIAEDKNRSSFLSGFLQQRLLRAGLIGVVGRSLPLLATSFECYIVPVISDNKVHSRRPSAARHLNHSKMYSSATLNLLERSCREQKMRG